MKNSAGVKKHSKITIAFALVHDPTAQIDPSHSNLMYEKLEMSKKMYRCSNKKIVPTK